MARKAIAEAVKWAAPGLAGMGKGHRTSCKPDEDSITMAVEAARLCLAAAPDRAPELLQFASTTAPFADRSNSVLASEALGLDSDLRCLDLGGSLGAGLAGLINALSHGEPALTVAADRRATRPGSAAEMQLGHGAAAVATGSEDVIAQCLATATSAEDFIDHYRSAEAEFDYAAEERWIRDEGQSKVLPQAIGGVIAKAGKDAASIDRIVFAGIGAAASRQVLKQCGLDETRLVDPLDSVCGNTGTAHPLLLLAHTLEQAAPGEVILVANFAQGAQCLLLETTEAIAAFASVNPISDQIANGREDGNYLRFLSFNDQVEMDWGIRAERDNRTSLSAFNRHRKTVTGFVGGKCSACGTRQFPKGPACVNPECRSFGTLEDEPFRDKIGLIRSFTEDWLAISPNPPLIYGNVGFDDGGVIMMEFTDFEPGELTVGMPVRFVFRIKDKDPKRGFRRYFWKAAPVAASEAN
ncbi:3-oxoacyl-[acyl-carrier-protein] synthase III C-terminal domain-containing protein [Erythrobacter aurantius]|uniref:3-oxoacyl-[acyl-carrier-protein] synthase III C-terminal domain-containing protein n=1 Tax=Erythrobacter aurantius TaxID=2909249 RepID=UPI00207AB5F0|nr:3-oxoacyl-[acyl-carrier-protein] synthase III C-terminal domain-containing protein [Erythrobacter aurantius]